MKGDFSHWQLDPNENFNGVLQQQGRVLLDLRSVPEPFDDQLVRAVTAALT